MMLLVIILISTTHAIMLDRDFIIEFNPNCSQFFVLRGTEDYAYLYREENNIILWHTRNDSYAIFSNSRSDSLVFEWPNIINGWIMDEVLSQGIIKPPFQFDDDQLLCEYYGLALGSLTHSPSDCRVFACEQSFNTTSQYAMMFFLIVLTGAALVAAGIGNYKPIKNRLQHIIFSIINQRKSENLSVDREETPPGYDEVNI